MPDGFDRLRKLDQRVLKAVVVSTILEVILDQSAPGLVNVNWSNEIDSLHEVN